MEVPNQMVTEVKTVSIDFTLNPVKYARVDVQTEEIEENKID